MALREAVEEAVNINRARAQQLAALQQTHLELITQGQAEEADETTRKMIELARQTRKARTDKTTRAAKEALARLEKEKHDFIWYIKDPGPLTHPDQVTRAITDMITSHVRNRLRTMLAGRDIHSVPAPPPPSPYRSPTSPQYAPS